MAYVLNKIEWSFRDVRYGRLVLLGIIVIYSFFLAGQTYKAIKPWENTISLWKNAIQIAPNMPDTYTGLMTEYLNYYLENPQNENAIHALQESEKIGKNAISRFCDKAYQTCPLQVNKILYHLGQINWLYKKYDLADKYFESALRLNPSNYEAQYMYAQFLIQQERVDEAMEHIKYIEKNANPFFDKDTLAGLKNLVIPVMKKQRTNKI